MGTDITLLLSFVLGKMCIMETTDGSRRREKIHHVGYREIRFGDEPVQYPTTLYFGESDVDGVDLVILKLIKIDEE
jgi:hypothetical protein